MKEINGFFILIIFIIIGFIASALSYFLFKIDFFWKHENLTFVVVCFICAVVYGIILFILIRRK